MSENNCVVCEFPIDLSSTIESIRNIHDITEISGRPLKDLLGGLFTQDYELLVKLEKRAKRNSPVLHVCDVCFSLLEQIDAFEHNLTKLRSDLTNRRTNGSATNTAVSSAQRCKENGQGSYPSLADEGENCLEDVLKTMKQVSFEIYKRSGNRQKLIQKIELHAISIFNILRYL